jgi:hypothetical protein
MEPLSLLERDYSDGKDCTGELGLSNNQTRLLGPVEHSDDIRHSNQFPLRDQSHLRMVDLLHRTLHSSRPVLLMLAT